MSQRPSTHPVRTAVRSAALWLLAAGLWLPARQLPAADGLDDAGGYSSIPFDLNFAATDLARTCAAQEDGKILLAGFVSTNDSEQVQIAIARVKPTDGLLDPTFDGDGRRILDLSEIGIQATHGRAYAMAVDPQGRILVAGSMVLISNGASIGFVTRLLPDGWIDPVFGINGFYLDFAMETGVTAMAIDPGGRIWLLGRALADGTGWWIVQLLDAGGNAIDVLHLTFPGHSFTTTIPTAMAIQPDGNVLVAGWGKTGAPAYHASMVVARYRGSTLNLDPTFGGAGSGELVIDDFESAYLRSIGLQPDRSIVVAGEYGVLNEENIAVTRLDANGSWIGGFTEYVAFDVGSTGGDGGGGMNRMVVQSDGKIVVAAAVITGDAGNVMDVGVARILAQSGLDTTFGGQGTGKRTFDMPPVGNGTGSDEFHCLTLSAGKPVLVGSGHYSGQDWDFSFRRLTNALVFADGFESGGTSFWSPAVAQ
jgi:uncharacterized delta-60 repeat protein